MIKYFNTPLCLINWWKKEVMEAGVIGRTKVPSIHMENLNIWLVELKLLMAVGVVVMIGLELKK